MFGLDLKSVVVGFILAYFVLPMLLSTISKARSK